MNITIDPEFKALIPPLAPDEYAQLEANIRTQGCRDPLVVWPLPEYIEDGKVLARYEDITQVAPGDEYTDGPVMGWELDVDEDYEDDDTLFVGDWPCILIDGHNRHEICTKHGIGFKCIRTPFKDRDEVMLWMEENQIGRRNLSDDQRAAVGDSIRERRSKAAVVERAAKANPTGSNQHKAEPLSDALTDKATTTLSTFDTLIDAAPEKPKTDTRRDVAKEMNVPERKLRNVQTVKKTRPDLIQKVRDGEIKLADAVRTVKREQVIAKLEDVAAVEQKALEGKYDVIVIDPPWPMVKIERDERPNQAAFEYPTMSEQEIAALEMPAADDCHMWLWTTHKFLPMALKMLDVWGFSYVCQFVWHKPGGFQPIGLPQYNCEFALYARKGSPKFIDTKAFPVCFNAPRGAHSEKPEEFYDVIRRVTAGRRIDIFNRRAIRGFDVWGKESA